MKSALLVQVGAALLAVLVMATLPGCGGGGGGGSDLGDAVVQSILVQGVAAPIYTNGQPPQPFPPTGVVLNARLELRFGGPIDPTSLPANGPANGSVRVTQAVSGAPAVGTWSVDPQDGSIVYFNPLPPVSPTAGCTAGLQGTSLYVVDLPDTQGGNQQVVRFADGTPIQAPAQALFQTVACDPLNPSPSFGDAIPGAPTVVSTVPPTAANAPTVTQTAIEGNPGQSEITVLFNEPLQPASITSANFRLVNITANGTTPIQVVGALRFDQTGTFGGGTGQQSRVVFTSTSRLADGDVFEILLANVTDLGNNQIAVSPGVLRFTVQDNNDDMDFVFTDDFSTTTNFLSSTGAIEWLGTGRVVATFPQEIVGNGSDGGIPITTNMNINTNLNSGRFNFTNLVMGGAGPITINYSSPTNDPATATSNWGVHLRATGTININTQVTILCNGRAGANGATNSALTPELGGWGGPGGGNGGTASPSTSTTVGDLFGLPGEGGKVSLTDINMPGDTLNTNINSCLFGGGGGGNSGPATSVGPSGGGGGTASMMLPRGVNGETQAGTNSMGAGAPVAGAGGPVPSCLIPPLMFGAGGSGGGAGGDRLDAGAVANHDTGGAGGGGGGSLRISAGTDITFGQVAALNCTGGNGGNSTGLLVAKGGGGSGGTIFVQTFTNVNLGLGVQFLCGGGLTQPNPPTVAFDGDGGAGGQGVVQLEDSDGNFPNLTTALVVGESFQRMFQFTGNVVGQAFSQIMDSGSSSTNYVAMNSLGSTMATIANGATGTANVMVIGIAEDPNNPGNPGTLIPSLMTAPTPLSNISAINGYRFFQYVCNTSFPAPPTTSIGQALPEVDFFQLAYRR